MSNSMERAGGRASLKLQPPDPSSGFFSPDCPPNPCPPPPPAPAHSPIKTAIRLKQRAMVANSLAVLRVLHRASVKAPDRMIMPTHWGEH